MPPKKFPQPSEFVVFFGYRASVSLVLRHIFCREIEKNVYFFSKRFDEILKSNYFLLLLYSDTEVMNHERQKREFDSPVVEEDRYKGGFHSLFAKFA